MKFTLKETVLLTVLLFCVLTSIAQYNPSGTPDLIPYKKGKQWGYKDLDGKVIIKAQFAAADFFNGDTAFVYIHKKLTKKEGRYEIRTVIINDTIVKDIRYKIPREYKYKYIPLFLDGQAVASIRYNRFKYKPIRYVINRQGIILGEHLANWYYSSIEETYMRAGNTYDKSPLAVEWQKQFSDYTKITKLKSIASNGYRLFGVINSDGDTIAKPIYINVTLMKYEGDSFFLLTSLNDASPDVIDLKGKLLFNDYTSVYLTKKHGYFYAQKNNHEYYLDSTGKILISTNDEIVTIKNGLINVTKWPLSSFYIDGYYTFSLGSRKGAIYSPTGKQLCSYSKGYKYYIKNNLYGIEKSNALHRNQRFKGFLVIK
jgi:hypothetical protein